MVEYGRFAQIERLQAAGWTEDEECQRLYRDDPDVIGGPTFMRAPDGRIHACTGGIERPIEGTYKTPRVTIYSDGRAIAQQG